MVPNLVADKSAAPFSAVVLPEAPEERMAPSQKVFRSLIHLAREVVHGPSADDRGTAAIALGFISPSFGVFLENVLERRPSNSLEARSGISGVVADGEISDRGTADQVVISGVNDEYAASSFAQAIRATNSQERVDGLISLLSRGHDDLHLIALGIISRDPDIVIAASAVAALNLTCSDDKLTSGLNQEIVERVAATAAPLP